MHRLLLIIAAVVISAQVFAPAAAPVPDGNVVDAELDRLVSEFINQYRLNEYSFSFAYYNTVTGETYLYNEHKLMLAASIYKLPLALYYYDRIEDGSANLDRSYAGHSLENALRLSLQYSDNEAALAMFNSIGRFADYTNALLEYMAVPAEERGLRTFNDNRYSALEVLNILKHLYNNSDKYPDAIEHLKAASPGTYFKRYVFDYEIAQKYGFLFSEEDRPVIANAAGIVYTPTPYLLAVFTSGKGGEVVSRLNEMLCEYTVKKHTRAIVVYIPWKIDQPM